MLPSFIGIGAQKAGTTWLHAMLSTHREIWIPHLKELHYFDRKFPINQGGAPRPSPRRGVLAAHLAARLPQISIAKLKERLSFRRLDDLRWELRYLFGDWNDEWYASLFENAGGRLAGEITPAYSCLDDAAVAHVHTLMPNAKLILLLRDPIERAWSHAKMDLLSRSNPRKLVIADDQYLAHFSSLASRLRGNYLGTIYRWRTHFPERQIFLGFYDEILESPEILLTRIFQFLEVSATDKDIPPAVHNKINVGAREPIPTRLHRDLATLYLKDLRELAAQYGAYPQRWLSKCERALGMT